MDISIYFQPSERFGRNRPEWGAHTLGDSTVFFSHGKDFPQPRRQAGGAVRRAR
ncbi:MAG: hypothetical protein IPJ85_01515 [Flavobacteriales bacterium]|nr:hypothetical protein [Flavobacteriales bacterium]